MSIYKQALIIQEEFMDQGHDISLAEAMDVYQAERIATIEAELYGDDFTATEIVELPWE